MPKGPRGEKRPADAVARYDGPDWTASVRSSNDNHSGQRTRWEIATDAIGGLVVAGLLGLVVWALTGLSGAGGNSL